MNPPVLSFRLSGWLKCWTKLHCSSALSFRDVQNLGVNLLGHQRKIFSAAQQLRAHLTQGQVEVWNPPTVQRVPWISVVFTFLCLLCLVSVTFISMEHNLSQNWKKNQLSGVFSDKPDTTTRRRRGSDLLPVTQVNNTGEMHYGSCCPDRSEVQKLLKRRRTSSMFFTRFHFVVVCLLLLTRLESYLSPSLPLPSHPETFPSLSQKKPDKKCFVLFFVKILMEISPHKELREDNQSLFVICFELFVKLYHFLST